VTAKERKARTFVRERLELQWEEWERNGGGMGQEKALQRKRGRKGKRKEMRNGWQGRAQKKNQGKEQRGNGKQGEVVWNRGRKEL